MFMLGSLAVAATVTAADGVSRVVSSEGGLRLAPLPSIAWRHGSCPDLASISVEHTEQHQTIGGFGASMLEAGAMNLASLPEAKQDELLELLFGPSGARLSALKATMLGNDFSTATHGKWTTYDDTPEDMALNDFSIERDLRANGSLTFFKRAIHAGFTGTIQAYMDYPPDWMLTGGLPDNATVRRECYDTLAHYMARYVQAYAAHGVHISFVEAFNEPTDSYTKMSAAQLATFLGQHAGPLFERLGLWPRTKLTYGGQCSRASAGDFIPAVMADADAAKYMDVLAYHGYDCQYEDDGSCDDERQRYDVVASLSRTFPGRPLWMTEICYAYNGDDPNCTSAATMRECTDYPRNHSLAPALPRRDFADGATWGHRLVREMQAGASGWIYVDAAWNLLLDTTGGPFNLSPDHGDGPGNYQHPVVVVDAQRGEFHPTGLFYYLAHFSRFVRPGAVRLGSRDASLPDEVSAVAFTESNVSSAIVAQLVNRREAEQKVTLCSDGRLADILLPASSITTARWQRVQG